MRGARHTRLSPSHASGAPRSRRACSCVKNLKKITSVPQVIAMSCLFSQPNHELVSGFPFPRCQLTESRAFVENVLPEIQFANSDFVSIAIVRNRTRIL